MDNSRFSFSQFSSVTVNGKKKSAEEYEKYLKEKEKQGITVKEKLSVGDKVKIKKLDSMMLVKYVDYEIQGIGKVDYAGEKLGKDEKGRLYFFNQKDIEKIVQKINEEER